MNNIEKGIIKKGDNDSLIKDIENVVNKSINNKLNKIQNKIKDKILMSLYENFNKILITIIISIFVIFGILTFFLSLINENRKLHNDNIILKNKIEILENNYK